MNNVIELLDKLGSRSELQNVSQDAIDEINRAYLDEDVKKALAEKDTTSLELLLRTKFKIYCVLLPAKEDDDESEDDEEKQDNDESDSDKEEFRVRAVF